MSKKIMLCPKCSQEIVLDENLFDTNYETNIECNLCHTKMILKNSTNKLVKGIMQSGFKRLGKLCFKGLEYMINEVNPDTIDKRNEDAYKKLSKLNIDKWNKKQLESQFKARTNLYEKQIIYEHLQTVEDTDCSD